MLEYFCSPGGSTEFFSLFCGKVNLHNNEGGVFGLPEEHENIRLHIFSVDEAVSLLDAGVINNAMTIIALQWFQLHKSCIDAQWLR
jgi:ADP-ribose pyrophosphatase